MREFDPFCDFRANVREILPYPSLAHAGGVQHALDDYTTWLPGTRNRAVTSSPELHLYHDFPGPRHRRLSEWAPG